MGMNILKDKQKLPPRIVLYGIEGIGKSTFAANAPKPIFIPTEDGLGEIHCDQYPLCGSVSEVYTALNEVLKEEHDYGTVVIDSLDWLERLIWDDLCREWNVKSIEKVDGGYARGYTHALGYWRPLLNLLDQIRERRRMVVIGLAHSKIEKVEDPECQAYTRNMPRMHKLSADLVVEWADAVLFATRKLVISTEDAGFNRKRAVAHALGTDGGKRVIRCIGGPACKAKNRYGMPDEMPLDWTEVQAAIATAQSS